MKAAFYKGNHAFVFTWLIRWWDKGPYSHCELVFSDGMWGSAVGREGGVVLRRRLVNPEDWDFVDLPDEMEAAARQWFEDHKGSGYDYIGLARFVFGFLSAARNKWFCSRACADALGIKDGWREGPNGLYADLALID